MKKAPPLQDVEIFLIEQFHQFVFWIIPMIRNALFLIIWIVVQFLIQYIIDEFHPINNKNFTIFLIIFKILFGVSTIIPIVMKIYRDSLCLWRQICQEISLMESKQGKLYPKDKAPKGFIPK